LSKLKKKQDQNYRSIKAYSLGDHYHKELKSSLSFRNLLSKSASKFEHCKARFTSAETVFEN
jgi:hypothetical protein